MFDTRIIRWIQQSVIYHVKDELEPTWNLELPGIPKNTGTKRQWIELHTDGPHLQRMGIAQWRATIYIHLRMISKTHDEINRHHDMFAIQRMMGDTSIALSKSITVNQYGDGETTVGCLSPDRTPLQNRIEGPLDGRQGEQAYTEQRFVLNFEE